jgi:hypothetical protein
MLFLIVAKRWHLAGRQLNYLLKLSSYSIVAAAVYL